MLLAIQAVEIYGQEEKSSRKALIHETAAGIHEKGPNRGLNPGQNRARSNYEEYQQRHKETCHEGVHESVFTF